MILKKIQIINKTSGMTASVVFNPDTLLLFMEVEGLIIKSKNDLEKSYSIKLKDYHDDLVYVYSCLEIIGRLSHGTKSESDKIPEIIDKAKRLVGTIT